MTKSTKVFLGLLGLYAFLAAINLYLPMGSLSALVPQAQQLPAPKIVIALASAGIVLVIYGLLGYLGLFLSRKLGWPDLLDSRVSNRRRFLTPLILGVSLGVILIVGDLIFSQFNGFGRFIHPPFPTSLVASAAAGIGEEIIFRLFFISFWVWLFSSVILKGRWQNKIFWVVAILSALAFAIGHYPGLLLILGFKSAAAIPLALHIEIISFNGLIGLVCAYYFRKAGFLAAVGIHFWTDIVWHVLWGLF